MHCQLLPRLKALCLAHWNCQWKPLGRLWRPGAGPASGSQQLLASTRLPARSRQPHWRPTGQSDRTRLHRGRAGELQRVAVGCRLVVGCCPAGWSMAPAGSELRLLLLPSSRLDLHLLLAGLSPPQAVQGTSGWLEEQPPGRWLAGPLGVLRQSGWAGARREECEQSSGEAGCVPVAAAAYEVQASLSLVAGQLQQLPQASASLPSTLSEPPDAPSPDS